MANNNMAQRPNFLNLINVTRPNFGPQKDDPEGDPVQRELNNTKYKLETRRDETRRRRWMKTQL